MKNVVIGSVALMVAVMIVSVLMYVTGLHQNALVGGLGSLVLVIGANIAVVFWVLKQTAEESGYLSQLGKGALVGVVGGILVFLGSMALLTALPDYLIDMKETQISTLEAWGANIPEEVMEQKVAEIEAMTPVKSSMQGLIGTFFTSLIVGAIVAIFKRKKR